MSRICVIRARRTPQGRFLGALAKRSAVDLGLAAARAAIDGIDPAAIDSVIVGNVLSAGLGMNVARQVAVKLGLPVETPAFTVNAMCASGMQAIMLAMQAIRAGDARCVLCGGTESMSNAPYLLDRARGGYQLGDGVLIDSLVKDGLTDPFGHGHMGLTAERLAAQYGLTRHDQDAFAARSQQRHAQAETDGRFSAEIVPLDELARDEHPRPSTTEESLAKLRPAFKPDGTVTAGNASGINDGAAMLLVCDELFAADHRQRPLAYLGGGSLVGCDPAAMGLGPVHATRKLCAKLGTASDRFDHVELNEAFAAQALACIRELKLDGDRVNPHGGAIAVGHPIGASGARIVTHLSHVLDGGGGAGASRMALATLCVGGGMGCAIAMEAVR
jgi:acetyl-CoA C-acetyltransferase